MSRLPPWVRPLLARQGMTGVLLLLCVWFSLVTRTEMDVTGAEAAAQVARKVSGTVLVIGRDTEEDRQYTTTLAALARGKGCQVSVVNGEPRDARRQLDELAAGGKPLLFIATTGACAEWPLLRGVAERFPALGAPAVVVPQKQRWPTFLTRQNLLNVANQITVVAILAAGLTVVIITGGIDLSVGSLIALSAVTTTVLIRDHAGAAGAGGAALVLCSLAAVLLCAGVGLFSGWMVASFKVPPFIATLAMMQVASGLAFIQAKGGSVYEVPEAFAWLGRATGPFGIPVAVLLTLALYAISHLLMTRTVLGRRLQAVGGNPEAARLAGVGVTGVLLFAYAFSGGMAGLAGVLQASQLKSGAPTYGLMYELYAVAAVVVGGTSLQGGEGRITGTLVGALIIAVIQNGMNLTGMESYQQKVVLGAVILGAVLLDQLKIRSGFGRPRP